MPFGRIHLLGGFRYYYGDKWNEAGGGGDPCNESSMVAVADGLDEQGLLDAVRVRRT